MDYQTFRSVMVATGIDVRLKLTFRDDVAFRAANALAAHNGNWFQLDVCDVNRIQQVVLSRAWANNFDRIVEVVIVSGFDDQDFEEAFLELLEDLEVINTP